MKKLCLVILVMIVETIALWIVSVLLNWNLMDVLFLGGLALFAVVWLVLLAINQSNNVYNSNEKGWTGQNIGGVKQFHVNFSPVMVGMVGFILISLIVTLIYYAEYF